MELLGCAGARAPALATATRPLIAGSRAPSPAICDRSPSARAATTMRARTRVDGKGRDAESGERRGRHSARADLHWDNISATPRPLRRHAEVCYPELRKIQKAGAAGKFSGWGGGKASRKGTPRFEFLLYSPWSAACIWSSTMHALLSAPPPAAPLRGGGASPETRCGYLPFQKL